MKGMRPTAAFLLAGLFFTSCLPLRAILSPETGSFVFQHFSGKEYGASPQNWSVTQDKRGVMYFGNTDGVLEFDGVSWSLIPINGVRGIAADDQGTVFVGGRGDLGLLKPDSTGRMRFVSLIEKVPEKDRDFADVWRVIPTPGGVYFSSYKRLIRLNRDGSVKTWSPQKKFSKAFFISNSLYVHSTGQGLMSLTTDDRLKMAPGGERLAGEILQGAISADDGGLLCMSGKLYRLKGDEVIPYAPALDAYLAKNIGETMALLPSGEIAVGTRNGGLVVLDQATGEPRRTLTSAEGLPEDFVESIFVDRQNGIWVTGYNGISRFNPGLSVFPKSTNLPPTVVTMLRHGDSIFAGNTDGAFRMKSEAGHLPTFERVEGLNGEVVILSPAGDSILAGATRGVYLISGLTSRQIVPTTTTAIYDISSSASDLNVKYAVGRPGVLLLRRKDSTWENSAEFSAPGEEFRSVLEDADGRVWVVSKNNFWRLDFRRTPVESQKFGTVQGVPGGWANVRKLGDHIVFATTKGLRRYSEDLKRFVPDNSLGEEYANGSRDVFNIFEAPSGDVWITGKGYHDLLLKQSNGTFKKLPMPLIRAGIDEIYWMSIDADGTAWVTGSDFVLHRFERSLYGDPDADFRVLTRRIHDIGSGKDIYGGAGPFTYAKLPWQSNALRFEFAAPFYEEPTAVQYRYQLEGSDKDWSAWSHETKKDYTHLPEGSYRFRVQARTPHGTIAEDSDISFGVIPPWYRTWWAYSIYAMLGAFGVFGIVQWRTKQLKEDKRHLEQIVEERTVEIREQRDEIQIQEEKSRELLLNILPVKVADELKATGSVQPVGFDDVTVCFTDFVGFTLSSEKLAPGKLVDSLNEYFTAFDEIIARYDLEKLKTIGDSYMFVSGLPAQRKSHAVDAVLAALEMVQVVKNLALDPEGTKWGIRVGLHSGPVVAGVVGIRKFAFDIWGNTVNFAARMESSGVPGNVNMSERTHGLLNGLIETEFRGDVKIKEGRYLPMYLAHGAAASEAEFAARYEREFGELVKSFPALQTQEVRR